MVKTKAYKVFAYPVEDLSIARYLAARETDYIGIPIVSDHLQKTQNLIFQFKEWLEGPKLIGIIDTAYKDPGLDALDGYCHTEQQVFYLGPADKSVFNSEKHSFSAGKFYNIFDKQNHPIELSRAFLEMDLSEAPINKFNCFGYVIHPGFESQTGICDFDLLDQWFDQLEAIQYA